MEGKFHQPVDAAIVPRFAGLATFMRLPAVGSAEGLDIALVGIPWDGGTTNRAGARHGPREVRNYSSLMRSTHHVFKTEPFKIANVADVGDLAVNPIDLQDSLRLIERGIAEIVAAHALPLSVGGDHLVTLPVLRAVARKERIGLIHFDAHSDTNDTYFGDNRFTHGTPFRRAIEEDLLDPHRVVQIGIRGSLYSPQEHDWAKAQGVRIVYMEEFSSRGPEAVMAEVRDIVGTSPTYVTFDIDSIDPSMAPGTGTPEIGGFTTREAQHLVRQLDGLNLIGADVVEVAPPFDLAGMTAIAGATIMFELLCVLARQVQRNRQPTREQTAIRPAERMGGSGQNS
ncbi:agmatinase [Mesorhizobium sp. M2A.F.Ca.ET.037.01.1.1]|uniref:agmatinase n=1 Tax=unclassified Mesorhizobium TaxID=325217 RepID=UPI000FCA341A|nr:MULTISPECIES: agmatinase [unclassified Mesorhizobium]RUX19386.1 agmatinase [Mesorhizobium sp. M2A.F.Ca.ET.037.01.1.1]RUY10156.1 agmatinase [Mesorhizobium sp. M2A.F.Ca.ET.040.01.1.1]RWA91556.1 MAG: agmatinase [Mesorhizobium sp.]TIV13675.1 MAG: agmatinase [Mesorhizobium sp.]